MSYELQPRIDTDAFIAHFADNPYIHQEVDLSRYDASSIVHLRRELRQAADAEEQETLEQTSYSRAAFEVGDAVYHLAERGHVELGREVYTLMASSAEIDDRLTAAGTMWIVTPHDHDFGITLWEQLLADPASEVRDRAYEYLDNLRNYRSDYAVNKEIKRLGLSHLEFMRLQHARVEALRTQNYRVIGATGLKNTVQ